MISSPAYSENNCEKRDRNVYSQLESHLPELKKTEFPFGEQEGEGSSLEVYQDKQGVTRFARVMFFGAMDQWQLLIKLGSPLPLEAEVQYIFYNGHIGTEYYSEEKFQTAHSVFYRCSATDKWQIIYASEKNRWIQDSYIEQKLMDSSYWGKIIDLTLTYLTFDD